jgi:hypothetical protein
MAYSESFSSESEPRRLFEPLEPLEPFELEDPELPREDPPLLRDCPRLSLELLPPLLRPLRPGADFFSLSGMETSWGWTP